MGGRPELQAPPELFYNETEAKKYSCSSRYIQIQRELAFRAYELLALPLEENDNIIGDDNNFSNNEDDDDDDSLFVPKPCLSSLLLDIGVGSGLCASVLGEQGHKWIGLDISKPMLQIARSRMVTNNNDANSEINSCDNDVGFGRTKFDLEEDDKNESILIEEKLSIESDYSDSDSDSDQNQIKGGDLILGDMGNGLGFRAGSFDGAISISALQWLCNADTSVANPRSRLNHLFSTLYSILRIGAKAVFQFYPETPTQIEMILNVALKVGFNGGMVVDFPNTPRRKKYFLVLMVGGGGANKFSSYQLPSPKKEIEKTNFHQTFKQRNQKKDKKNIKDKSWVIRKKDLRRKRGFTDVPEDTKYTARKRGPKF